jgi:hypothetical protein
MLSANVAFGLAAVVGPDGTVTAAWRTTPNANPAENATLEFAELAPGAAVFGATKAGPDTVRAIPEASGSSRDRAAPL